MAADRTNETASYVRTYERLESVVFLRTRDEFGGLSNMASGYDLSVNGVHILTSEALYQACRFPHLPTVQRLILDQSSPMAAKMKSKPYRPESRRDWDEVRLKVMRWCLRVKLTQHWTKFSELLLVSGDRPIVEESRRDDFWGAKPVGKSLVGTNALGRLLMELRSEVLEAGPERFVEVLPLPISDFKLLGQLIVPVSRSDAPPERPIPGRLRQVGPQRRSGRMDAESPRQRTLSDWLLPEDDL
jgi:ribA/ribD-fused uncharacterized protein